MRDMAQEEAETIRATLPEAERALALDRNLANAHALIGSGKTFAGRAEETEAHVQEALRENASIQSVDHLALTQQGHAQCQDGPARHGACEQVGQVGAAGAEHFQQAGWPTHQRQGAAPWAQGVEHLRSLWVDQHMVGDVLKRQGGLGLLVERIEIVAYQVVGGGQHLQACGDAGQVTVEAGGRGPRQADHLAAALLHHEC